MYDSLKEELHEGNVHSHSIALATNMHQALCVPEILLNIFHYCCTEYGRRDSVDLAALARTCRAFKEPALDSLWGELYNLSPLARCLPEACNEPEGDYSRQDKLCSFSRPLKETEWVTLYSYTRRVRLMCISYPRIAEEAIRAICSLAPFDDPLFPQLRSLHWNATPTFVLPHVTVPLLKDLHLHLTCSQFQTFDGFLDAFGDCCPDMESFQVDVELDSSADSAVSSLVCRWLQLQQVACLNVTLNMDAMLHLSSVSSLTLLKFKAGASLVQDLFQLNQKLVFSSLTFMEITSESIHTITLLFRCIRLPAIETLNVAPHGYISRLANLPYWTAVQEACSSNVLAYLLLQGSDEEVINKGERFPCLTMDDLRPCAAFTELRGLAIELEYPVNLTDADLLNIVSPHMEYLSINFERGWELEAGSGGITLTGLVQLLQQCPSLGYVCLAIDTQTFSEIPEGLDMSFPPRAELKIDLIDSYILPELVPGLVSVFTALGLRPPVLATWGLSHREELWPLWKRVLDALRDE